MAVPDNEFTSEPFLPGNVEDLMELGQFNTELEIVIGTNLDDGMNFFLFALAYNSLFDYYRLTFNTSGPMGLFDIPFESGRFWLCPCVSFKFSSILFIHLDDIHE